MGLKPLYIKIVEARRINFTFKDNGVEKVRCPVTYNQRMSELTKKLLKSGISYKRIRTATSSAVRWIIMWTF